MSPLDDQFLAGSEDAIRLWDLRSPNCQVHQGTSLYRQHFDRIDKISGSPQLMNSFRVSRSLSQGAVSIVGRPAVAFDPSGLVFAVALGSTLRLYDVKSFDQVYNQRHMLFICLCLCTSFPVLLKQKMTACFCAQGPFSSATIGENLGVNTAAIVATQLEFSSDGKYILVTTAADAHYIIDAYQPQDTCFRLVGHYSYGNELFSSGEEACWTPDGKSVVSGSRDGGVYVWDIARAIADRATAGFANGSGIGSTNGLSANSLLGANRELKPFKVLKAHGTPSHIVAFNPKYLMMVSGSTELVSE